MKRLVTAVMRHETNTFSPVPTPLSDFGRVGPTDGPARGEEALRAYRGTNNPVAAYIDLAAEEGAELNFAIAANAHPSAPAGDRSEAQTSELQSLLRISSAVFCLKKNKINK